MMYMIQKQLNNIWRILKSKISQKIENSFLTFYVNQAKGPEKLKILVNYLTEKEPEFLARFIKNLETENTLKLEEMNKVLKETETKKKGFEEKNTELKEVSEEISSKVILC